jgi:hypothetical protein
LETWLSQWLLVDLYSVTLYNKFIVSSKGRTVAKELKIWNGRGLLCRNHADPRWRDVASNANVAAFVAAYSRADACRVIESYTARSVPDSELRDYWSAGLWGNEMNGITPERGLWLLFDRSAPIRVI